MSVPDCLRLQNKPSHCFIEKQMSTLYQITVVCVNILLCQNCSWCQWVHINVLLPKWQGLICYLSYLYSLITVAFSSLFCHIIRMFMVTQFLVTHITWHLLLSNLTHQSTPPTERNVLVKCQTFPLALFMVNNVFLYSERQSNIEMPIQ